MNSLLDSIRLLEKEKKSNHKDPVHIGIIELSAYTEKPINEVEKEVWELIDNGFVIKINTLNNYSIKTNEL